MRNRLIIKKDSRNPYGSRGGYVRIGRRDRKYDYNMPIDMRRRERSEYMNEYDYPRHDMRYDYPMYEDIRYDYAHESTMSEDDYEDLLEEKCKELKKHDKFGIDKREIINQAKAMGIQFDTFDEKELLTTYYMMMSDYKMDLLNSPQAYIVMAKDFLDDRDSELQGGEKLLAYLLYIVEGKALQ